MEVNVDWEKCTGCAICISSCPADAIELIDNRVVIHKTKCFECGSCVDDCPNNALNM